jgi:hypothetical protein
MACLTVSAAAVTVATQPGERHHAEPYSTADHGKLIDVHGNFEANAFRLSRTETHEPAVPELGGGPALSLEMAT